MNSMARLTTILLLIDLSLRIGAAASADPAPTGWRAAAPRDEIRPSFAYETTGGHAGKGSLVVQHDAREGLDGYWTKTFPVAGGRYYQFQAFRKTDGVPVPRRSAIIRILW